MKFVREENRIIALNDRNEKMGHIAWKVLEDGVLNANGTFVDPNFRGQGVAQYLLKELVMYARHENKKIFATCSFVVKMFKHGDEYKDVIDPTRGIGDEVCKAK